jgi:hypothetical protein
MAPNKTHLDSEQTGESELDLNGSNKLTSSIHSIVERELNDWPATCGVLFGQLHLLPFR